MRRGGLQFSAFVTFSGVDPAVPSPCRLVFRPTTRDINSMPVNELPSLFNLPSPSLRIPPAFSPTNTDRPLRSPDQQNTLLHNNPSYLFLFPLLLHPTRKLDNLIRHSRNN